MRDYTPGLVQVGKLSVEGLCEMASAHGTDATNFFYAVKEAYGKYRVDLDALNAELAEKAAKRKMDRFLSGADLREYNSERHDPDSIFFDDSYTGPSERELSGGCNRCGGFDDCYCN